MFDSSHIHLEFAQGGHHPVSGHSFWGVFCSIARFALVWDLDATGRTFFSFHSTPQLTRLPPQKVYPFSYPRATTFHFHGGIRVQPVRL